jgi:3-oxoacyl-[acyl-carrier-protein] synthase-1/3-oxoacyl-[acyl-carrier-protein] synthase II
MSLSGEEQWQELQKILPIAAPVVRYRPFTGEFASASALAAVFAASFLERRVIPGAFIGGADIPLSESASILILGLGRFLTAMELYVPPKI